MKQHVGYENTHLRCVECQFAESAVEAAQARRVTQRVCCGKSHLRSVKFQAAEAAAVEAAQAWQVTKCRVDQLEAEAARVWEEVRLGYTISTFCTCRMVLSVS